MKGYQNIVSSVQLPSWHLSVQVYSRQSESLHFLLFHPQFHFALESRFAFSFLSFSFSFSGRCAPPPLYFSFPSWSAPKQFSSNSCHFTGRPVTLLFQSSRRDFEKVWRVCRGLCFFFFYLCFSIILWGMFVLWQCRICLLHLFPINIHSLFAEKANMHTQALSRCLRVPPVFPALTYAVHLNEPANVNAHSHARTSCQVARN